jgi:hypothetical protein
MIRPLCLLGCLYAGALATVAAEDLPPPTDPNAPVTVQTTTTQTWVPGGWQRVGNRDVWQPGHWETVQTTSTLPASTYVPPPAPVWVAERWERTSGGWVRYAGHWSNQPETIAEYRGDAPVVVERPVVVAPVVAPGYVGVGYYGGGYYGGSGWNVSVGVGSPWYPWYYHRSAYCIYPIPVHGGGGFHHGGGGSVTPRPNPGGGYTPHR